MRLLVLIAALAAAAPAAIKAMTLEEMVSISEDVVDVQIVAKETFRVDTPGWEHAAFTRISVVGESLVTGEPVRTQLVYQGSHDPSDGYISSEMPAFQDVRVGNRAVIFYGRSENFPGGELEVWNFGSVFRVESVLAESVVMGKGEGFAFHDNVTLVAARDQVRVVAAALDAARQDALDGLDK